MQQTCESGRRCLEYRRKRRVGAHIARQGQGQVYSAYIAIFIVFFGVVYLISASKAGTWIAENWIAPALKSGSKAAATVVSKPEPSAEPVTVVMETISQELVLPEKRAYALQIGVYADQNNAVKQSEALSKIGAAGYVLSDGDRYRVLASAYEDEESAKKVSGQLLAEGIESRTHTLIRAKRTLKATGTSAQLTQAQKALNAVDPLLASLYEAFLDFDKNKESVSAGLAAITAIRSSVAEQVSSLSAISAQSGALDALISYYTDVLAALDAQLAKTDASVVEFSSGLKQLYITALLAWDAVDSQ